MSKKHGQTGPRTDAGKQRSSRNAFRHGLCSSKVVLDDEDRVAFEGLRQDLIDEHQPATATEELLVDQMAQSYWRLERANATELDALADEEIAFERVLLARRYATSFERAFHKALQTLRQLQKDRAKREQESFRSEEPVGQPILAAVAFQVAPPNRAVTPSSGPCEPPAALAIAWRKSPSTAASPQPIRT